MDECTAARCNALATCEVTYRVPWRDAFTGELRFDFSPPVAFRLCEIHELGMSIHANHQSWRKVSYRELHRPVEPGSGG